MNYFKSTSINKMFRFLLLAAVAVLTLGAPKPKTHPRPGGRIVGGQAAQIEDYPYQLSLLYGSYHICGASILNNTWAITAAHCTDGSSASSLSVRAGSSLLEQGGQVVRVKTIYQNPSYDYYDIDYDISVLELESALVYGDGVQPIPLIEPNVEIPAGTNASISGWGTLNQNDWDLPEQLQVAFVPIVTNADCADAYVPYLVSDRMLCAGYPEGGIDACQGDSGGPLVVNGVLAGLTSWGYGCANRGYPGVYSNVSALRNYVTEVSGL